MSEFQTLLIKLLSEQNRLMSELLEHAVDPEAPDHVNSEPKQRLLRDGNILRVRTEITKNISAITHLDEETHTLVYAAFEDVVTGERVVCPLD